MQRDVLASQLQNLLRTHDPVKARQLGFILSEEFGLHVDRSAVNSVLYRLRGEGTAEMNAAHEWSVATAEMIRRSAPPEEPVVRLTEEQQSVADLAPSGHLLMRAPGSSGQAFRFHPVGDSDLIRSPIPRHPVTLPDLR